MSRQRQSSAEKPDFRLKMYRDMIPEPPDHYTPYQRRQYRQEEWDKLQQGARGPVTSNGSANGPRARAGVFLGRGLTRTGRSSTRSVVWKWVLRPLGTGSVMMFFLLAMAVLGGAEGPIFQFARLIGVIATLGESTSLAAGQALNVTGAIAAAATEVISSATSNGLNAAENAWSGVDVSQLEAHRCAGILTVDGPEVLADWLNGSAALVLIPCLTGALIEQLMAAVTTVSLALPLFKLQMNPWSC